MVVGECYSVFFFFSSRRRHTRWTGDWSSDVCSSDLAGGGTILQRNFTTFVVEGDAPTIATLADGRRVRVGHVAATSPSSSHWSLKQWTVLGDHKLDGAGSGFFEYRIPWPAGLDVRDVAGATFLVEASAKRLNGKDRDTLSAE